MGSDNGYRGRSISDDQGGEYFSWVDARSGDADIYVQHLTAAGDTCPGWGRGGLAVCAAKYSQYNLDVASDSHGGLLLAWQDFRSGHGSVVYAARMTAAGSMASGWGDDGLPLGDGAVEQVTPRIVGDGGGGALIFWREPQPAGFALRAQHITASGGVAPGWPDPGVELVSARQHVAGISAISDPSGNTSLFWRSSPDSSGLALRLGRLASNSAPESTWANSSNLLSGSAGASSDPTLMRDPDGGMVALWSELSGASNALRLQKFSAQGLVADGWPQQGVQLVSEGAGISPPALLSDGSGGVIVAWEDRRSGSGDIWAQHVKGDGTFASGWESGALVCDAHGEQHAPMLASDGNGGTIATWIDDGLAAAAAFVPQSALSAEALPRFLRAETNSGYARLFWETGSLPGVVIEAFREASGGDWIPLSQLAPDDSSHLVLEDRSAPAGAYARYRLSVEAQGQQMFLSPVDILIPSEPTVLAIDRAWAPSSGNAIRVEFALPRGREAHAEIFDITGRRVGGLALGTFPPGRYRTDVPFASKSRAGVYFIRLTQGARAVHRRVVVVR